MTTIPSRRPYKGHSLAPIGNPAANATAMSTNDLRVLLDDVPDTRELVLRVAYPESRWSPVHEAWRAAREDAGVAWSAWASSPGDRAAYAAYRAAQDREDAAQDALTQTQTARAAVV